jgi:hypothetical protein
MGACDARTQGALDSSAIEATEDAAACVHSAFQRPVLVLLEVLSEAPLAALRAIPEAAGRIRR